MFVAPTLDLVGLDWNPKKDTVVRTNPDSTFHEIGKFLRLALKGNPTIIELFWVEKYTKVTYDGARLSHLARSVLSEKAIRAAYLGYAVSQAKKLESRGDSFSSDLRKRTAKHGRHMLRLIRQARQLAETGELVLEVANPQEYWDFDEMTSEQMLAVYQTEVAKTEDTFVHRCVLPEHPDIERVARTLKEIRKAYV